MILPEGRSDKPNIRLHPRSTITGEKEFVELCFTLHPPGTLALPHSAMDALGRCPAAKTPRRQREQPEFLRVTSNRSRAEHSSAFDKSG
jgi:hypothetical protein